MLSMTVIFASFWNDGYNCSQASEENEIENTDDSDEPEETVFVNGNKGEEQRGTDSEGASSV